MGATVRRGVWRVILLGPPRKVRRMAESREGRPHVICKECLRLFRPASDYAGTATLECTLCGTPHVYRDWTRIWEWPATEWVCFVRHLRYVMEEHGQDPAVLKDDPKACTVYLPVPHNHGLKSFSKSVDLEPDSQPEALRALAIKIYDEYRGKPQRTFLR